MFNVDFCDIDATNNLMIIYNFWHDGKMTPISGTHRIRKTGPLGTVSLL